MSNKCDCQRGTHVHYCANCNARLFLTAVQFEQLRVEPRCSCCGGYEWVFESDPWADDRGHAAFFGEVMSD